jgi:hypothetical protein
MALRLCTEIALAGCLALAACIWGVQSTAPAVLAPENAAPSQVTAPVPFPLATVILPADIEPERLAELLPSGYVEARGGLGPHESPVRHTEDSSQRSLFHRAGLGKAIPDARDTPPSAGPAMEVASILPPAKDGT